jgi:type VI protein secretion system component Hcp
MHRVVAGGPRCFRRFAYGCRCVGAGGAAAGKEFLRFKFDTVFTTRIDWSGPGDEGPEESITFVYGKLAVRVTPQDTNAKPVQAGWDQLTNREASDLVDR